MYALLLACVGLVSLFHWMRTMRLAAIVAQLHERVASVEMGREPIAHPPPAAPVQVTPRIALPPVELLPVSRSASE